MTQKLIVIGLGTYKRPQMLGDTLASFHHLRIPDGYKVELIIADNDEDESAHRIVMEHQEKIQFSAVYIVEPRRGIVYMRNRIMEEALKLEADLLAFMDDDEEVEPDWLVKMLEAKETYRADVVVGRVERILPQDTPKWIIKGKFFERPSIKTGTVRRAASTSNVVFDLPLIATRFGLRFHPALNLAGSSDTFLFTEATEKGARIVWVNENLVKEAIPVSRMTVDWLLKRAFRHTNCRTLRKRLKKPYLNVLFSESLYGIGHLIVGVVSLPVFIFQGKAGLVHSLRWIWKGAGSFSGLGGFVYKEYENVHGY